MSGTSVLLTVITVLAATYAAYGAVLMIVYPASLYPFAAEPAQLAGFERIEVPVPDAAPVGVLAGGAADGPLVLFFMGNAGALGLFEPWLRLHEGQGRRVVAMEYRGGGGHPGRPSEARLKADALAVHDWLAGEGRPVTLHGFSMGTGLAVHVAARRPVAGAILEAPFASACRLMARASLLPACIMPVQRWNTVADVADVAAPVLILHGEADLDVPIGEGRRLSAAFEAAGRAAEFVAVPGGRHGDLPLSPVYEAAVEGFFAAQAP